MEHRAAGGSYRGQWISIWVDRISYKLWFCRTTIYTDDDLVNCRWSIWCHFTIRGFAGLVGGVLGRPPYRRNRWGYMFAYLY